MKRMFMSIKKVLNACIEFILATILVVVALFLYIPLRIIFPTKIVGRKHLKEVKGGKIIASNHYSNFDGVLLVVFFYPITYVRKFLAKIELSKNKLFGYIFKAFGAIYIDRSRLDIKAMRETTKQLQKGKTLIMFPEGTRNKSGDEETKALKGGVIYFANKADATIVPVIFLHRPKPFKMNKIIVSRGYKIDKEVKCNTEQEIEKLDRIYKSVREEFIKEEKGE